MTDGIWIRKNHGGRMEVKDVYWYHVVYSTINGQLGSVELGLLDELFVPADVREHIKKQNNFDFCVIVNWKRLEPNQISVETLAKFMEKNK